MAVIVFPSINWTAVAVAALLSFGAGAKVATWRADLACAEHVDELHGSISKLEGEKHQIELAVAEQNKGIAVAKAQTQAAEAAKEQAEQHASDLAQFSRSRMDKLAVAFTKASTCGDVLKSYWEMRK